MVNPDLLKILACPQCKRPVVLEGEALTCASGECRRRYRIDDDIPIMLVEEAQILSPEEWARSAAAKAQAATEQSSAGPA